MRWNLTGPRNRPFLIAAIILLVGLASAVVIFLTAAPVPDTLLEFSADSSKKYLRDLELYGGTEDVLAVEAMEWFKGLWHGRSLAYTVVVIAIVVCLGYLFFAVHVPHDAGEGAPGDDDPGRELPL